MRKRKKKIDSKVKKEEIKEISPFSNIVLKEISEEEKSVKKEEKVSKPSDIVQGYNPNLSFKDILDSFEKTGNPYSLKKNKVDNSKKEDFASILDKWENKGKPKKKSSGEYKKSEYKSSRSFSDILDEFEGKTPEKKKEEVKVVEEIKKDEKVIKAEIKNRELNENLLKKDDEKPEEVTFFKKEEEDEKRSSSASWSIYGSNDSFKRAEVEVKKEEVVTEKKQERVSKPYKKQKEFSEILNNFYGEKKEDKSKKPEKKEKEKVKTFEEILKEKGDLEVKKENYTLSQLRVMKPLSSLDLHGMGYEEAKSAISSFISSSYENKVRKISIITGKGLHSQDGEPVLKNLAITLLDESNLVSERINAPTSFGGSGVLWIILKKKEC